MKYKTLVIGLGQIGMCYDLNISDKKFIYSHSRAVSKSSSFDLVGGVDKQIEKRKLFQVSYNVKSYSDILDAIKKTTPDIIIISVPTKHHQKTIDVILKFYAPKVILCEKPISYNILEAKNILDICKKNNVHLFINYMRKSEPGAIKIKHLISNNFIQKPVKGVVFYSKGFLHNGSHFFNLIKFWLGNYKSHQIIRTKKVFDNGDVEIDVLVQFKHGQLYFLSLNEEDFSHYSIEMISPNGRLLYEHGGRKIRWFEKERDEILSDYFFLKKRPLAIKSNFDNYQSEVFKQLKKFLDGKNYYLCSGEEAYETQKEMNSIIGGV